MEGEYVDIVENLAERAKDLNADHANVAHSGAQQILRIFCCT